MEVTRKSVEVVLASLRKSARACEAYLLVCNEALVPELREQLQSTDEVLRDVVRAPVKSKKV